jgi:hypothetical protein
MNIFKRKIQTLRPIFDKDKVFSIYREKRSEFLTTRIVESVTKIFGDCCVADMQWTGLDNNPINDSIPIDDNFTLTLHLTKPYPATLKIICILDRSYLTLNIEYCIKNIINHCRKEFYINSCENIITVVTDKLILPPTIEKRTLKSGYLLDYLRSSDERIFLKEKEICLDDIDQLTEKMMSDIFNFDISHLFKGILDEVSNRLKSMRAVVNLAEEGENCLGCDHFCFSKDTPLKTVSMTDILKKGYCRKDPTFIEQAPTAPTCSYFTCAKFEEPHLPFLPESLVIFRALKI